MRIADIIAENAALFSIAVLFTASLALSVNCDSVPPTE